MTRKLIVCAIVGGLIGALLFGSIAAVSPGAWTNIEAAVIGWWIGFCFGGIVGVLSYAW